MTPRLLKLSDALRLPLDIVTQKLAWLGVTGSGKTYGASKLFELLFHAGAQSVALDPVGVWWGVRLDQGGKKPSAITVPVFGGLHGDVPLESTGGALLADLIVDKALSAIVDVSQFESDAQKARFAADFADRLFQRRKAAPSAMHLFLEEVQEFVPQNPQRGDERMLHVFTRMQKLGRNYGIGSSYISQRPQEVNKKALNMAQTLFVFRTTGTHERKAIEAWVHDKALDQDIAGDLPKIPTGHCHVWSPEFLSISKQVHILEKETFNASATPEVGAAAVARELAPIDLEKIRTAMAATIEKAKADDPRELRKQIADLQKQLAAAAGARPSNAVAKPEVKRVEVLTDADRKKLDTFAKQLADIEGLIRHGRDMVVRHLADTLVAREEMWTKRIGHLLEKKGLKNIVDKLSVFSRKEDELNENRELQWIHRRRAHSAASPAATTVTPVRSDAAHRQPAPQRPVTGDLATDGRLVNAKGELKKHVRMFLTSMFHTAGLSREQLHLLNGYVPSGDTSSGLNAILEHGLAERSGDRWEITPAGRQILGDIEPMPTGAALRDRALASAQSSAETKVLTALFEFGGRPVSRADLHAHIGLKPSGDTSRALNKGKTLGWIVERDGGFVAADHFFEDR